LSRSGGRGVDEVQVAACGQDGLDVADVEFFEVGGEPAVVEAGEQPGGEVSQVVQMLAGMVEVDYFGGSGEELAGEVGELDCGAQIGGTPKRTVLRATEDLATHGVVTRRSPGRGLPDLWKLNPGPRSGSTQLGVCQKRREQPLRRRRTR
jgi:hypothetical protein